MAVAITKESGYEHELTLTRTFDGAPDLVFKAWTDPVHLAVWWGPKDFTNPRCEFDARPGGAIRIDMRGPDGTVYPMAGTVEEIDPPRLLVFTSSPLAADGTSLFEVLTTVDFAPTPDGKTLVTLNARVTSATPQAAPYLAGMEMGWTQSLDRLADLLRTV